MESSDVREERSSWETGREFMLPDKRQLGRLTYLTRCFEVCADRQKTQFVEAEVEVELICHDTSALAPGDPSI